MKVLYKIKANGKHITTDKICKVLRRRWSLCDVGNADTLNEVTVRGSNNGKCDDCGLVAQYSSPHKQ